MKKWIGFSLFLCISVLMLTGCGQGAALNTGNPGAGAKKVTIGLNRVINSAPLFVGVEKGFFKEQGLDVDLQWFDAAHPVVVAVASNQLDVGGSTSTASTYTMLAEGQKYYAVADKGREEKGYPAMVVLVTPDLYNQGVRKIEDLKGKKIGVTQVGSTYHYTAGRMLEQKGLSLSDVEIVALGSNQALMETLKGKQVDAVILYEPFATRLVKEGAAKQLALVGDIFSEQLGFIIFSPNMIKDRETAIAFLKGYIQASRYYYDAVLAKPNGQPPSGEKFDDVVQIIAKYTNIQPQDVKTSLPYFDRDAKLTPEDFQRQIDWFLKNKLIDKPVNAKEFINTELRDEALKRLGQ